MSMHLQFAADVPAPLAAVMAAVQGPVTQAALVEGLHTEKPAWTTLPSWSLFGELGARGAACSYALRSEFVRLRAATARVIDVLRSPEVALPWATLSSGEFYSALRKLALGTDFPHLRRTGPSTALGSGGDRR